MFGANGADDIAFVGHGGVGTLLLLSLSGRKQCSETEEEKNERDSDQKHFSIHLAAFSHEL